MAHSSQIHLAVDHPANAGIMRYLSGLQSVSVPACQDLPSSPPEAINDPYMNLGTHPELVARLWDEITANLPVRCAWVVYGSPALVRPDTGIVFAFAGGTSTYALRLPAIARAELAAAALRQAEERAGKFGLMGTARQKYLDAQSGNVHTYSDGSTFDISSVGKDWGFGRWLDGEVRWCRSAYEHAV